MLVTDFFGLYVGNNITENFKILINACDENEARKVAKDYFTDADMACDDSDIEIEEFDDINTQFDCDYVVFDEQVYDIAPVQPRDDTPKTSVREMKNLKEGDEFWVNGEKHIASCESHLCGDATVDEYVVYDENNEGWFESDFYA